MLPSLPQYMIALLKILLAAAPTSKVTFGRHGGDKGITLQDTGYGTVREHEGKVSERVREK